MAKKPKQVQTAFRTSAELKAKLEQAAKDAGLTFNKEVNRRLSDSFRDKASGEPALQNAALFSVLKIAAVAMETAGSTANVTHSALAGEAVSTDWMENPRAFRQAVQAAVRILNMLQPDEPKPLPKQGAAADLDMDAVFGNFGTGVANGVLREIASDAPTTATAIERAPRLRRDLPPAILARIKQRMGQKS